MLWPPTTVVADVPKCLLHEAAAPIVLPLFISVRASLHSQLTWLNLWVWLNSMGSLDVCSDTRLTSLSCMIFLHSERFFFNIFVVLSHYAG